MRPPQQLVVNCSILFTEFPLLQRPQQAARAGFDAVEFWWPWPYGDPGSREVDEFVAAVEAAGVGLHALNFFAGDLAGLDRGAVSVPALSDGFRASVEVAASIGRRLGVRGFNALYGNRVDWARGADQDALATRNLAHAAEVVADIGATVLVEPLSGAVSYPLRTAADAAAVVDRIRALGHHNIGILFDVYHLTVNHDDVDRALADFGDRIAHVQIADAPGRGAPGTGHIDFAHFFGALQRSGYRGPISLEYVAPAGETAAALQWLAAGSG